MDGENGHETLGSTSGGIDLDRAARLIAGGASLAAVARVFGVHRQTVRRYFPDQFRARQLEPCVDCRRAPRWGRSERCLPCIREARKSQHRESARRARKRERSADAETAELDKLAETYDDS